MWEMQHTYYSDLDCLTGLVAAFANNIDRPYELIFIKPWNFVFTSNKGKLIDRVHLGSTNETALLEQYCGIHLNIKNVQDEKELRKYCLRELQISPIIVHVDAFDCSWCPVYQKYSFSHYLMIVDMNRDDFICIDTFFRDGERQELPIKSLRLYSNKIIQFEICDELPNKNYTKLITDVLKGMEEEKRSNDFYLLKEYFADPLNLLCEIEDYKNEIQYAPLFLFIKRLGDDLKWFARGLNRLERIQYSEGKFDVVKRELVYASDLYKNLSNIIMRNALIGTPITEQIVRAIERIEVQEKIVVQSLEKCM